MVIASSNVFIKSSIAFLANYIEYLLLIACIVLSLVVYYMKYFSYLALVFSPVIGICLYLLLRRHTFGNTSNGLIILPAGQESRRIIVLASILFFIFFTISVVSLLWGYYSKSPWYFVFIAICTATIAVEIPFIQTEMCSAFNLFKSFLLVLNITMSNQIVYPQGIALPDFGLHFNGYVLPILATGVVPEGVYQAFPAHHIFAAVSILLLGTDPKTTYLWLGCVVLCLGILFVYIIGKKFVNQKFGLFVAVLFTCLDYYIMYGSHPEHQAYNYAMTVILFAVIMFFYYSHDRRYIPLCLICMVAMIFTHHLSAVIVFLVLGAFILAELLIRYNDPQYTLKFWPVFIIFGVVLMAQWIYYSYAFNSAVGAIEAYTHAFQEVSANIITSTAYDQLSLTIIFLNSIGSCILIILGIIGVIISFKKKTLFNKFLISLMIVLVLLLGVGIVFKQVALLPDRIYPFIQVFALVFLAAEGIIFFLNVLHKNSTRILALISLFLWLSFFSCASTIAGFETSPFVNEQISYFKDYSTYQEEYSGAWNTNYFPAKSETMNAFPLNDQGILMINEIPNNTFLTYDKLYLRNGFISATGSHHMGQYIFRKMKPEESNKLDVYGLFYMNGIVNTYGT